MFFARFFVQHALYNQAGTADLGIARILMGWPLTAVAVIVTIWMAKRAQAAVDARGEEDSVARSRTTYSIREEKRMG